MIEAKCFNQKRSFSTLSAAMNDTARTTGTARAVDNTDWLKAAAIILVSVDHIGYFFIENNLWWSTFGRLAAPPFFFLMGYAQTRAVPLHWVWLGLILTLLESWNADWTWVSPNILLSFALIRLARPHAQGLVQRHGWAAFALAVLALLAVLPITGKAVDYGAAGWLWALLGLCQRLHVDDRSAAETGAIQDQAPCVDAMVRNVDLMRLLACLVAAVAYDWQEQREYAFPQLNLAVFVAGVGALSLILCLFERGRSRIQPPQALAGSLRFIGRHTLEIYAIQLAGSELIALLR
jgi:hypothetical protein